MKSVYLLPIVIAIFLTGSIIFYFSENNSPEKSSIQQTELFKTPKTEKGKIKNVVEKFIISSIGIETDFSPVWKTAYCATLSPKLASTIQNNPELSCSAGDRRDYTQAKQNYPKLKTIWIETAIVYKSKNRAQVASVVCNSTWGKVSETIPYVVQPPTFTTLEKFKEGEITGDLIAETQTGPKKSAPKGGEWLLASFPGTSLAEPSEEKRKIAESIMKKIITKHRECQDPRGFGEDSYFSYRDL